MGHRTTMFPDHHDENGPHKANRVHRFPQEVNETAIINIFCVPVVFTPPDAINIRYYVFSVPIFKDLPEETLIKISDVLEEVINKIRKELEFFRFYIIQ